MMPFNDSVGFDYNGVASKNKLDEVLDMYIILGRIGLTLVLTIR